MVLWGSTFAASKILIEHGISPLEILIARFTIAWLLMQLIPSPRLGFAGWRRESFFIVAGLGGVTLYFLFENTAVSFTYASNVGLICGINPLFTAALFWVFYRERPRVWFFVGSALAVFGIVCVAGNGTEMRMGLVGDLLAVLACLCWSFYTVAIRKIRKMAQGSAVPASVGGHAAPDGSDPVSLTGATDEIALTRRVFFWGMVGSLLLVPFSGTADFLRVGAPLDAWLAPEVLAPLLYLAVLASCLCYAANNFAMRVIGEVAATSYIYTLPAISMLASHILLGEPVTPLAVVGMVAITLGLLVSEEFWKRNQKEARV
jgi:drug/metabolite transporter (DMT)-like permease